MSSDHPFDDQLKQSFDGFEPNVHANWAEFERSLDAPQAAEATSSAGRGLNRWAVAAAVAAGGALMWVTKPVVERAFVAEQEVVDTVGTKMASPSTKRGQSLRASPKALWKTCSMPRQRSSLSKRRSPRKLLEAPSKASPSGSQTASDAPRAARALQQHNGFGCFRKRSRAHGAFARRIAI